MISRAAVLLGGFSILCSTAALGATPTAVAEIANYRGADRQAMLEAGARKEGVVTLYTTGTQIRPILDAFTKKYPYLRVQTYNAGTNEVASKATQEYAAQRYDVDGFELESIGLLAMKNAGVIQPFWSPQMDAFPSNAVESGHNWVVARESYIGLGYNTKLVRPQDVPRTYRDLLLPRWKGKIALSGTTSTVAPWLGAVEQVEGADFVRSLAQQNVRIYQLTSRALANLIISGEVVLSPTIYSSHVEASRKTGAPIGWRSLGPSVVNDTGVALASHAPHPHAMLLLADFLLSKEGQRMYQQLGYSTARRDVQAAAAVQVQKLYLTQRPTYFSDFKQWVALYQQFFLK